MLDLLRRLADNRVKGSYANLLRQRRFRLFREMVDGLLQDVAGGSPNGLDKELAQPLKIIDVGGTRDFWRQMGFLPGNGVEITLLNLKAEETAMPGFVSLAGDGRDMAQFEDQAFDVAFSNSVIEHVGGWAEQQAMAGEMRRVGKRVFLQTPNRYFPIEPHFLFPFFQFLPVGWRICLLMHFRLGWYPRHTDRESAKEAVETVRLLSGRELKALFPGATIVRERFLGLTKSFVVIE